MTARRELLPVVRKARVYLRNATVALCGALAVVAATLVGLDYQASEQRRHFDDNTNVHVISVAFRLEDKALRPLSLRDVDAIRDVIRATGPGSRATVSPKLTLGTGLVLGGDSITLIGIDPGAGSLVGLPAMADGEGYTTAGLSGSQRFSIPVVTRSEAAGVSSNRLDSVQLEVRPALDPLKVKYLEGLRPGRVMYVTAGTFWGIAEKMLTMPKDKIVSAQEAGQLDLVPIIESVYVDVAELDDVRPLAASITGRGYAVSYALEAFDSVETALWRWKLVALAVGAFLMAAVGWYFFASWQGYLRLSRRDIGILRHWRVTRADIVAMYAQRLWRSLVIAIGAALVVLVLGEMVLTASLGLQSLVSAVALVAGVLPVGVVVRAFVIPRWVDRDVLTLLRAEREFQ